MSRNHGRQAVNLWEKPTIVFPVLPEGANRPLTLKRHEWIFDIESALASDTDLGTPGPQETDEPQTVQQESGSEIAPPEDKGDQPTQRTTDVERSERMNGPVETVREMHSEETIACIEAVPSRAASNKQ